MTTTAPPPPWDDTTPLGEVRDWLRTQVEKGAICPCCTQDAKVYPRPLNNAIARMAIAMWLIDEGRNYIFLPDLKDRMKGTPAQGGDGTKGVYWKLMEKEPGLRDDGSNRRGFWRLTDLGREWVQGRVSLPKTAHVYNKRCLRLSGSPTSVIQALGSPFDYDELMGR